MLHSYLFKKLRYPFLRVFLFGVIVGSVGLSDWSWLVGSAEPKTYPYTENDGSPKNDAGVQAEERTATYTLWLAVGTFVLAVGALWQISFLRRADETARKSANAAQRAAKAAEDSILKADDTARRELRAYITVEANGIEHFGLDSKIIASVRVHNAGRVPARNIRWVFYDCIDTKKLREQFDICNKDIEPSTNLLGPGAQMLRFHECSIRNPDREAFRHGDYAVYVWGKVLYQDGFEEERWTRFCHRYEGDCLSRRAPSTIEPKRVRQHQYGNSTDEDAKKRPTP